jgi:hypothetical protein
MSKDLRKQLAGVIQDSPPVDQEPDVEPDVEPQGDDKDQDDGDKGRSLDNVRGELLRKQDKLRDELADLKAELRGISSALKSQPKPAQPAEPADDLMQYSVQQLESLRGQIPEEKQAEFDRYIMKRTMDEEINSRISVFTREQQLQQKRDQYNRTATSRYPDLADLTSEFAREVNYRLQDLDEDVVNSNPRIVLDLANEVAIEKGVKPSSRRVIRGRPATADTAPAPTNKPKPSMSDEEMSDIAKRLQGALPKGKKFDMDRVKQRVEFYSGDETDLRINK